MEELISDISVYAHKHITNPPGGGNVTEWCKKEECWRLFVNKELELQESTMKTLNGYGENFKTKKNTGIDGPDEKDKENIKSIMEIPAEVWFEIAVWSKQTNNLLRWQRGLAFSLGQISKFNREPSRKQAFRGLEILKKVTELGFKSTYMPE